MTQRLDQAELQNALALSQAACYASMSAKEHREGSPQSEAMLKLTEKLSDMTISALNAATLPEILPRTGEPTLADIVAQAKAANVAGEQVPDVVIPVDPSQLQ